MISYNIKNLSKTVFFHGGDKGDILNNISITPYLICNRNNFYIIDILLYLNSFKKILYLMQSICIRRQNFLVLYEGVNSENILDRLHNNYLKFSESKDFFFYDFKKKKNLLNLKYNFFKILKYRFKLYSSFLKNYKLYNKSFNFFKKKFKIKMKISKKLKDLSKLQFFFQKNSKISLKNLKKNSVMKFSVVPRIKLNYSYKFFKMYEELLFNKIKILNYKDIYILKNLCMKYYIIYKFIKFTKFKLVNFFFKSNKNLIKFIKNLRQEKFFKMYRFEKKIKLNYARNVRIILILRKKIMHLIYKLKFFKKYKKEEILIIQNKIDEYFFKYNLFKNQNFNIKNFFLNKKKLYRSFIHDYRVVDMSPGSLVSIYTYRWVSGILTNFYGLKSQSTIGFNKIPELYLFITMSNYESFIKEAIKLNLMLIGFMDSKKDLNYIQYYLPVNSSSYDLNAFYFYVAIEAYFRGYLLNIYNLIK